MKYFCCLFGKDKDIGFELGCLHRISRRFRPFTGTQDAKLIIPWEF